MINDQELKNIVHEAYDAVKDLSADESFKLEGFKIVLGSQLAGVAESSATSPVSSEESQASDKFTADLGSHGWRTLIARRMNIGVEDVSQIYDLDDNGSLRLILKNIPPAQAAATKDIAALLSAGRQASKIDASSTSFEVIRDEVDDYGRLNKSNFTRYLQQMKPNFKIEGKGKEQAVKVTAPGFEQAAKIAKKYLKEENKK